MKNLNSKTDLKIFSRLESSASGFPYNVRNVGSVHMIDQTWQPNSFPTYLFPNTLCLCFDIVQRWRDAAVVVDALFPGM